MSGTKLVTVARTKEIPDGEVRNFEIEDVELAICNIGGRFFAVEDICTHDGGPLGEGCLEGYAIECPRHGAQFDVRTGEVLRLPAAAPIRIFPVHIENGEIRIEIEDE